MAVTNQRVQRRSERETTRFRTDQGLQTPPERSPEAVAQVRILPGAHSKSAGQVRVVLVAAMLMSGQGPSVQQMFIKGISNPGDGTRSSCG